MYDFLIYDFDGTISDTYPVFTAALMEQLKRHEIKGDYDTVYAQLKVSVGHALSCYDFGMTIKEAKREFHGIHEIIARREQRAFPQSADILKYANDHGKKNYIYTHTGKFVFELLDIMKLTEYFDFIMDGSYDFPRKPAPDGLNFITEKCGIDKSRALMIGDRDIDIDAAHNAGIAGCLIDTEGYYPNCRADHRINTLDELKNII